MVVKVIHFDDWEELPTNKHNNAYQNTTTTIPEKIHYPIYPGSFDPIHYGHLDIIKRAANIFGGLTVAVGINSTKKHLFTLEERVETIKQLVSQLPNVKVTSFNGLLFRYASQNGINTIVKGVRDFQDFQIETTYHNAAESQHLDLETVFLPSKPELSHISSSMIKIIQQEQGDIHEYVPTLVKQKLEEKLSGQYIIGITGETGSGKSYVGRKFVELGEKRSVSVHNIELDIIGHEILGNSEKYQNIRYRIVKEFGEGVRLNNGGINRRILGDIVFADAKKLEKLNEILHKPILSELQEIIHDKKGLILINTALIAEANISHLCNNNIIIVDAGINTRSKRLQKRGYNQKQIQGINNSQYSFEVKRQKLQECIEENNYGHLWTLDNSQNENHNTIEHIFEEVINYLRL